MGFKLLSNTDVKEESKKLMDTCRSRLTDTGTESADRCVNIVKDTEGLQSVPTNVVLDRTAYDKAYFVYLEMCMVNAIGIDYTSSSAEAERIEELINVISEMTDITVKQKVMLGVNAIHYDMLFEDTRQINICIPWSPTSGVVDAIDKFSMGVYMRYGGTSVTNSEELIRLFNE